MGSDMETRKREMRKNRKFIFLLKKIGDGLAKQHEETPVAKRQKTAETSS